MKKPRIRWSNRCMASSSGPGTGYRDASSTVSVFQAFASGCRFGSFRRRNRSSVALAPGSDAVQQQGKMGEVRHLGPVDLDDHVQGADAGAVRRSGDGHHGDQDARRRPAVRASAACAGVTFSHISPNRENARSMPRWRSREATALMKPRAVSSVAKKKLYAPAGDQVHVPVAAVRGLGEALAQVGYEMQVHAADGVQGDEAVGGAPVLVHVPGAPLGLDAQVVGFFRAVGVFFPVAGLPLGQAELLGQEHGHAEAGVEERRPFGERRFENGVDLGGGVVRFRLDRVPQVPARPRPDRPSPGLGRPQRSRPARRSTPRRRRGAASLSPQPLAVSPWLAIMSGPCLISGSGCAGSACLRPSRSGRSRRPCPARSAT